MKIISAEQVHKAVYEAIRKISFGCDPGVLDALGKCLITESNPLARDILSALIQNHRISLEEKIPLCQDTGTLVVFAELGNEVMISGAPLQQIIDSALSAAYTELYLRASIVKEPLYERENTKDNSPAQIHIELVEGENLKLLIAQKGGGAENMSALYMLKPGTNEEEIIELVQKRVIAAGGNPCPPIIIGIGIGGTFDTVASLAKRALYYPLDYINPDARYAALERKILAAVNNTGVGPQGLGGDSSALAVHICQAPCHIASLPLAINLQCHAHRFTEVVL